MSKKILAILLVLCMSVSLAACTGGNTTSSTASGSTSSGTESTESTGSTESSETSTASDTLAWTAAADVTGDDAVAGETDDRAFQKFENTVDVHIGCQVDPTDTTLPQGDAVDNNMYTRYLKDTYNINTVVDWTAGSAADFNQKVALQIASGSLPDGMVVTSRTYMVKAARAGLTADLFSAFNDYASKQVKQIMETTNGRAYSNGTVDGTFVGLPNVTVDTDGVNIYFIRKDWLDQCGLEVPKTVSELETAAKAFMDKGLSPKYAIAGKGNSGRTYTTFLESSNNGYGFDAVYEAMGAQPGWWLKDDSGEVYYGTNTPAMRSALETLAKWYKEGLINPELGVSANGSEADGVKGGTCGIFMGPWWSLGYGNSDSFKNDNTADWQGYPLYNDNGEWNIKMKDCGTSYTIVSKNATEETIKAIMIMNNALVRDESILISKDDSPAIGWFPLRNTEAAADECEYEYNELYKVLKGETTAEDYNVPGSLYKNMYTDAKSLGDVISKDFDANKDELNIKYMDVNTNNGMFNRYYAIFFGDKAYATTTPTTKIYSELYAQTDEMETYWSQLQDLEDQTVMSIITGKSDISAFDTYVEDWTAQGGQKVIDSVKAMVG